MTAKERITPERFYEHLEIYAYIRDFKIKTKYLEEEHCRPGHYQGNCYDCWNSQIVEDK